MTNKEESNSVLLMRKVCDQIQEELLAYNLQYSAEKHRSVERFTQLLRDNTIRLVSTKLGKFLAIEEKYTGIIHNMREQITVQKEKNKELYQKYEKQLFENDRIKMETLEVSEAYENAVKSYEEMKQTILKIKQKNKELQEKNAVTQSKFRKGEDQIENYKYQLYQKTIQESQEQIQGLKEINNVAQKRIMKLQEENEGYLKMYKSTKQSISEISRENEQLVRDYKKVEEKFSELECQKLDLEKQVSQLLLSLDENMKKKNFVQEQKRKIIQQLEQSREDKKSLTQTLKLKNTQYEKLSEEYNRNDQSRQKELEVAKFEIKKIADVKKQTQELESKYEQKINLLTRYLKQQQEKNKEMKNEVGRLYEAMNQLASKEYRYAKRKEQVQAQNEKLVLEIKGLKGKLVKRKQKNSSLIFNIKNIRNNIRHLKTDVSEFGSFLKMQNKKNISLIQSFVLTYNTKIILFDERISLKRSQSFQKIQIFETENQELVKRCVEYQRQIDKFRKQILDYRQKTDRDMKQKEEIIFNLKRQIEKQKNSHSQQNQRILSMIQKFTQRLSSPNQFQRYGNQAPLDRFNTVKESYNNNQSPDYNRELQMQRIRFSALQKQYQSFLYEK